MINTSTEAGDRSLASILLSVIRNVEQIVQSEIRLAKAEMRIEFGKAGQAAKLLGLGLLLAILAAACLCLACVYLLATVLAFWIAALIVAVTLSIVAGVMISVGISKMCFASAETGGNG